MDAAPIAIDRSRRGGARPNSGPKRGADQSAYDDLVEAKARRESAHAELAELELAQRRGELLERKAVADGNRRAGMAIRDGVLSVPGRVAAGCVGLDERKIDAIMTAALREELTRIADLAKPNGDGNGAAA